MSRRAGLQRSKVDNREHGTVSYIKFLKGVVLQFSKWCKVWFRSFCVVRLRIRIPFARLLEFWRRKSKRIKNRFVDEMKMNTNALHDNKIGAFFRMLLAYAPNRMLSYKHRRSTGYNTTYILIRHHQNEALNPTITYAPCTVGHCTIPQSTTILLSCTDSLPTDAVTPKPTRCPVDHSNPLVCT